MATRYPGDDDPDLQEVIDALYRLNVDEGRPDCDGSYTEDEICEKAGISPSAFQNVREKHVGQLKFWFHGWAKRDDFSLDQWGIREAGRRAELAQEREANRKQAWYRRAILWLMSKSADAALTTVISTVVSTAVVLLLSRCSQVGH